MLMDNAALLLVHRGPDQQEKVTLTDRRNDPFEFGMTRLNIVERNDITIPFEARGTYISFNGEIYNWREIREKLKEKGVRFDTNTDIEVFLNAYLEWGPACLNLFNGMFAIAIWKEGELFLGRDRLGKKPLFYYSDADGFAFASEIKAFSRLELEEVELCQKMEFYFDEFAPFQNVKSLRPGEYMLYDSSTRNQKLTKWWSYPKYEGSISDMDTALKEFIPLFEDACRLRKMADVPVYPFRIWRGRFIFDPGHSEI